MKQLEKFLIYPRFEFIIFILFINTAPLMPNILFYQPFHRGTKARWLHLNLSYPFCYASHWDKLLNTIQLSLPLRQVQCISIALQLLITIFFTLRIRRITTPSQLQYQTVNDGVAHSKNPRKCAYHVTYDLDLEHTLDAR